MSPMAPPHPCGYPGCHRLVSGAGRCESHRRQENREFSRRRRADPALRELDRFYSSRRWRALRLEHLAAEPLCRECGKRGRVVAAEMVDHVIPIRQGGTRYDHCNLQSLCNSCHGRKQIEEGSRFGK